ncbi:ATPase RavA [compost metagenome]
MPRRVIANMHQAIIGQDRALDLVMSALLAGGHILLDDVPGVGKTLMAKTLAQSIDGAFKRVQFSPDLMPSDVTGINVFTPLTGEPQSGGPLGSQRQSGFRFIQGPVFANVLLADEINRASPRTQASLLEAMEEGFVTVDGETHLLPKPFLVIATQNPVEFQGTFPLPEAQLDRFAVRLSLGYPTADEEQELLRRSATGASGMGRGHDSERILPVLSPQELKQWQQEVREVRVDASLQAYIVQFANLTRNHPQISLGLSPRGSLTWQRMAQAYAYLQGRRYVTPDDLKTTAHAVLAHRLLVSGRSTGAQGRISLLDELLGSQPIPV